MKRLARFLPSTLALTLAIAFTTWPARADQALGGGDDIIPDQDTSLVDNQADIRQFLYGSILFDYYSGRYYAAINGILSGKAQKHFNDQTGETELLLGNIYSRIDMPRYADAVYSRIIQQDTLSSIKQQTWLSKGELYMHRGQLDEAEKILSVPRDALTRDQDVERRVLLSNIYFDKGQYAQASKILDRIPLDTHYSAYAFYNAGVDDLRAGQHVQGLRELEKVVQMAVGDEEVNAIKDRASLAIAYDELHEKHTQAARQALLNVRIDGPFSDPALLAMGYVHYAEGDYKKALSFWLELLKRNPADPSVLEAMMLAPRAYEELKAYPQALFGYEMAAKTFRAELVRLETISYQSHQPGWLESLDVNARDVSRDPFATVDTVSSHPGPAAVFLYKLFSQPSFDLRYQDYLQLGQLSHEMDRQQQTIQALGEIATIHRDRIAAHQHEWHLMLQRLSQRNDLLQQQYLDLQQRIQSFGEQSAFTDSATYADVSRLHRLQRLENSIAQLPDNEQARDLRERLRRVRGVVLWNIAHNAPLAIEQARIDIDEMRQSMRVLTARIAGIRQLLTDSDAFEKSRTQEQLLHIAAHMTRSRQLIIAARQHDAEQLLSMTDQALGKERTLLKDQLASALLASARLQDSAASTTMTDTPSNAGQQP